MQTLFLNYYYHDIISNFDKISYPVILYFYQNNFFESKYEQNNLKLSRRRR